MAPRLASLGEAFCSFHSFCSLTDLLAGNLPITDNLLREHHFRNGQTVSVKTKKSLLLALSLLYTSDSTRLFSLLFPVQALLSFYPLP